MKTRFTEEQTIEILKEYEAGKRAAEIVWEHNITELLAVLSLDNHFKGCQLKKRLKPTVKGL